MRVLGFTGLRALTPDLAAPIELILAGIIGDVYVTGGAIGLDAFTGQYFAVRYPDALHFVIVPDDLSRVDAWWSVGQHAARIVVRRMQAGSSYADRNQTIVNMVDELHAFPEYPEAHPRSRRSGTWQTVRMARRGGVFCHEHVLRVPAR